MGPGDLAALPTMTGTETACALQVLPHSLQVREEPPPRKTGAEPLPWTLRWLRTPEHPSSTQPCRDQAALPYSPFLAGLTRERSLQGLPPITRSKGPHSSI